MIEPMVSCAICLRKRDPHLHDNGKNTKAPPAKAKDILFRCQACKAVMSKKAVRAHKC